jgi:hypothetical protein
MSRTFKDKKRQYETETPSQWVRRVSRQTKRHNAEVFARLQWISHFNQPTTH